MDINTKKYFDNYEEMFGTLGWQQLIDDLSESLDGTNLRLRVLACKTELDLGILQGELQKVQALRTFEAQLDAAREQVEEDEIDDVEDT